AGREGPPPPFHAGSTGEPEGVAAAQRPSGLDRLDDRRAAAEQGIRIARVRLAGNSLTELLVGLAIGGIDVVAVEAICPLHHVAVEVDHRVAAPAPRRLLPGTGRPLPGIEPPRAPRARAHPLLAARAPVGKPDAG